MSELDLSDIEDEELKEKWEKEERRSSLFSTFRRGGHTRKRSPDEEWCDCIEVDDHGRPDDREEFEKYYATVSSRHGPSDSNLTVVKCVNCKNKVKTFLEG